MATFFGLLCVCSTNNQILLVSKQSRPILQDRTQDQDRKYEDQDQVQDLSSWDQDRDQNHTKLVSNALETKTTVSRTTFLEILCEDHLTPFTKL